MAHLTQILLLLGVALAVVLACQRLRVPSALGYLLVGVILGPHTVGPTVQIPEFAALAEFGVVFLLFTIGLNFSLPQLRALRHKVLGLGTGQVVFTTAAVGLAGWLAGLPAAAAFVLGAVFAQSSTTIIASLLKERGEDNAPHGRLGLAMSVFQDVTAVPFLVVIPVLGVAASAEMLAGALTWAMAKALLALALVFLVGRLLLRRLIHHVAEGRSAEMFTLTVLLIALLAAWTTHGLGLSLAFGGFLAGMILGETEFRHQVEATMRPFRDVLLGLFFVGIGMLFDPAAVWPALHWALLGAAVILASKLLIVAAIVRRTGLPLEQAWRTALLLAVGGEFGLALVAIALDARVVDAALGQIAISAVLLSMVVGAVLIRFNGAIAARLAGTAGPRHGLHGADELPVTEGRPGPVVIGGYGRVGHTIAVLLHSRGIPFVAFDTDPQRVAQGRADGHAVSYGDIADPELHAAIHVDRAALVLLAVDHAGTALKALALLRSACPHVPVVARARNLEESAALLQAGAAHAYPEAIEASLRLGATALQMLRVPAEEIEQVVQAVRDWDYRPVVDAEPDAHAGQPTAR
jgi:CPA2 family monovalent cation:H+ antiporter-2